MFARARSWFLAILAFIGSLVTRRITAPIAQRISKLDPFDNLGRYWSHVTRFGHRRSFEICASLALVATTIVPANAMPVFSAAHGAVSFWSMASAGVLTIGATAAKAPAKKAFRYGTVRRRLNIGTFTVTPGAALPAVRLPQVGMLARVLFDIEGTYTVATAPLVVANLASFGNISDGMDAIFARAQITLNNGSANLVDLSGVGVNAINQNINSSLPIKRGTAGTGNVQGTGFGLALGASTFTYKGILPVNANQKRQFELGLINLQAPEIQCTVNLSFNPLATLFTTPANATLWVPTINLSYEYYEIPNQRDYGMPPLTLCRSIEEAPQAIGATGDQIYQIPRLGTMIEYHGVLVLNLLYVNVLTKVSQTQWRYNKSDTQYQVLIGDQETYEAEIYGTGVGPAVTPSAASDNAPTWMNISTITWNFWCAGDRERNGGDFRDAIDTEENTTTEVINTITTGTALNAGKDNFFHVRRVVQRITPVAGPQAMVA